MEIGKQQELLLLAVNAAIDAGEDIWKVYNSDNFETELKSDNSPLTKADRLAHIAIMKRLEDTGIPVLSEEGKEISFDERKSWEYLWVVDPLDGTKEFVKKNGEFTVNIALVKNQRPLFGVVYVPAQEFMYFGGAELGSYSRETVSEIWNNMNWGEVVGTCKKLPSQDLPNVFTIVASRSHLSKETEEYITAKKEEYGDVDIQSKGSALKICLIAEQKAHAYPRFAPTMEWDTASGHAILLGAGKDLIDMETKHSMLYNRKELRNNWFLAE
jgi:3'(2'), 5'-bisphosphate nucleotidase